MPDELQLLVRRCLAGDQAAMIALVHRYRGQVFGLCYRMLGQRQDAEDAAQETFVRALRSLRNWDARRRFEPWLLAIAGNRCRTALQKRRHVIVSQPLEDILADGATLEDDLAARRLSEDLQTALYQMRDEYRQAFSLFHEQGLSYSEIARTLDSPIGTIRTWIHRARRQLIARLVHDKSIEESGYAV